MKTKFVLILPTIREDCFYTFIRKWKNELKDNDVTLIIVEDHKEKEITIPKRYLNELKIFHYCWEDIKEALGKDEWIIPRRNAGIRNFGFLKAKELNPDIIINLDDDCYPDQKDFFKQHEKYLNTPATLGWVPSSHEPTRGFPYDIRDVSEVIANHGLWSGVPDYDGITFVKKGFVEYKPVINKSEIIPLNNYFPFCSMNYALKPKALPIAYLPLMGEDQVGNKWGYDRFDDIWGGIIFKKIADHLGYAIRNGSPSIRHNKASNVARTVEQEASGLPVNEWFWKKIDEMSLNSSTLEDSYLEIAKNIKSWNDSYFQKLGLAMELWIKYIS